MSVILFQWLPGVIWLRSVQGFVGFLSEVSGQVWHSDNAGGFVGVGRAVGGQAWHSDKAGGFVGAGPVHAGRRDEEAPRERSIRSSRTRSRIGFAPLTLRSSARASPQPDDFFFKVIRGDQFRNELPAPSASNLAPKSSKNISLAMGAAFAIPPGPLQNLRNEGMA